MKWLCIFPGINLIPAVKNRYTCQADNCVHQTLTLLFKSIHFLIFCVKLCSLHMPESPNEPQHEKHQWSDCAPSEDSDQPGHPPSLIRVFAVRMKKAWVLNYPLRAQRRLIRLGGCPGWSESSLGAHSFCWFCHVAAQILKNFLNILLYVANFKLLSIHQSFVTLP